MYILCVKNEWLFKSEIRRNRLNSIHDFLRICLHFILKNSQFLSFGFYFLEKLHLAFLWPAEKEGKKPKALYIHLEVFHASHFLFSALTQSLCHCFFNNNNNLLLSQIPLASAEAVKRRGREETFHIWNWLWKETQTKVSVNVNGVPLAGLHAFILAGLSSKGD